MKQFNEIIDKIKKILIKIKRNFDFNFKNIFIIINAIIDELKRKSFDFVKKFENVFNFKETNNLLFHQFYNYQIKFTNNLI